MSFLKHIKADPKYKINNVQATTTSTTKTSKSNKTTTYGSVLRDEKEKQKSCAA